MDTKTTNIDDFFVSRLPSSLVLPSFDDTCIPTQGIELELQQLGLEVIDATHAKLPAEWSLIVAMSRDRLPTIIVDEMKRNVARIEKGTDGKLHVEHLTKSAPQSKRKVATEQEKMVKRRKLLTERTTIPLDEGEAILCDVDFKDQWIEWQAKAKRDVFVGFINHVEVELARLVHRETKIVYGIRAVPDDKSHVQHVVCYLTSREKANELANGRSSHDSDDGVTWHYHVFDQPMAKLQDFQIALLDKVPSSFPYTGW